MKHKFTWLLLIGIFVVGLFIRIIGLGEFPPGLNWDETSIGYNAYSLLHTGRDEWGTVFPLIFPAFGDYKLPLAIFMAVPAVGLFGTTAFAVRLISALMGALLVPLGFILMYRLFKNRYLGLLAALLLAFQPWTWFLSRAALEGNIALTLLFVSVALYLSGKTKDYLISLLFFALSAWTYNSARGFVPLYLVFLAWHFRARLSGLVKSCKRPSLLLFTSIVLLAGMSWQLLSSSGQARFSWMTLVDSGAVARIEELRLKSDLPVILVRLMYNRPVYFVLGAANNFVKYLNPDYLFFSGGSHYQFSIPGFGLFSQIYLPLFYIGLLTLLLKRNFPHRGLLLGWLVLSLVPGSIVRDAPHPLRSVTFIPLAVTLIVAGWYETGRVLRLSSRMFILPVLLSLPFIAVYAVNLPDYSRQYSWSWQYGNSKLVEYVRSNYSQYDQIIMSKRYGEPHIFMLYFWPWSPIDYQNNDHLVRYEKSNWLWVDSFAKFRFVNDWEMEEFVAGLNPDENVLIIASPENNIPATRLTQIDFLSQDPAYVIYSK